MSFSSELITVLDYLAQKLGIVIDWTSDNVMPYLKDLCARYIEYEILNSFIIIGAWVLCLLVVTTFMIPLHVNAKRLYYDTNRFVSYAAGVAWIGFGICVIGVIAAIISQGFHIVECWKMPEKVIIEYIQGLLESQK